MCRVSPQRRCSKQRLASAGARSSAFILALVSGGLRKHTLRLQQSSLGATGFLRPHIPSQWLAPRNALHRQHRSITSASASSGSEVELPTLELDNRGRVVSYKLNQTAVVELGLASTRTYLAAADTWGCSPLIANSARSEQEDAPKAIVAQMRAARHPMVVFVERCYLQSFLQLLREQTEATAAFVLVTSGSDAPLTRHDQEKIMALPGLRACFATNLHTAICPSVFFPLPVGFYSKSVVNLVREILSGGLLEGPLPWQQRDRRILVPWMRSKQCGKRLRRHYIAVLSGSEYKHLVRVETEQRLPIGDYMRLLGEHAFVLSPPGKGYDCSRTWESLLMGSVPLVFPDPSYDARLYHGVNVTFIPRPSELSPSYLERLLDGVSAPEPAMEQLNVKHWRQKWESFL